MSWCFSEAPSLTAPERIETWEDIPGIDGILRRAEELEPIEAHGRLEAEPSIHDLILLEFCDMIWYNMIQRYECFQK